MSEPFVLICGVAPYDPNPPSKARRLDQEGEDYFLDGVLNALKRLRPQVAPLSGSGGQSVK